MNVIHFYRGLIIVEPHGTYIKNNQKKLIVKTKKIKPIVNKPLLLIEKKIGLGIIELAEPFEINLKQFKNLYRYHLITQKEREKWWPSYDKLYGYQIKKKKIFKIPLLLNYPTGPQITVKPSNIQFKQILIGISGYYYPEMINPKNKKDLLKYYSKYLNSVEINHTFYRQPTESFISNLQKYELKYSIKVNQLITHYKKLKNIETDWKQFYYKFEPIKDKISCFLFQFNSIFIYNLKNFEKLSKLSKYLDPQHRYAFEFRDNSWFNETLYQLFEKNKWIVVISHLNNTDKWAGNLLNGFNPPLKSYSIVSDAVYFRLHGTVGQYIGSYSGHLFKEIFEFIKNNQIKKALIYFNNTDDLSAWHDANKLIKKFNYFNII